MKRLLSVLVLGIFAASLIVGCEASGRVGDTTDDSGTTTYKKTTTQEPNGDTSVRTEVHHDY